MTKPCNLAPSGSPASRSRSRCIAALMKANARRSIVFAILALTIGGLRLAQAAAPMERSQPGFYRMMLGDFEVTALNDGVVSYATSRVLPTATAAQIKAGLAQSGLTDPVAMSYNAFLVNTGSELVLIDTGTGGKLDDQPEFHGAGHLSFPGIGRVRAGQDRFFWIPIAYTIPDGAIRAP